VGEWFRRVRQAVINLSFPILVGLIILLYEYNRLAPTEQDKFIIDVIKDIAVVIIGVSVVEIVWAVLGGSPIEFKLTKLVNDLDITRNTIHNDVISMSVFAKKGDEAGITDVGHSQGTLAYPEDILTKDLYAARVAIDFCGCTLNYIRSNDSLIDALVDVSNRGIPVRILLPSPDSGLLVAIFQDQFENAIKVGSRDLTDVIKSKGSKIQLGHLRKKAITTCILRVDGKMLVMPYLYAYQTSESPRYLIRDKTRMFEKYQREFDDLFAIAENA
jgi:hypothetical protein